MMAFQPLVTITGRRDDLNSERTDAMALGRAVEFLASQGTAEKAERLRRYGIQPGGLIAAPWSPPVLDMEALDQSFPPDVPGPHDQTAAHPAVVDVLPGIVEDRAL